MTPSVEGVLVQTVSAPVDRHPDSEVRWPSLSPRLPSPAFSTFPVCEMGVIAAAPHFHVWEEPVKWSSVPGT